MSGSHSGSAGAVARAAAAKTIATVIAGAASLNVEHLAKALRNVPDSEIGFTKALCFGVLRWYPRLACFLEDLLDKPLRQRDSDIEALLLVGIFQLGFMRVSEHAVVSETVKAARKLKKDWASGLVNAVLRRFQRERQELENRCKQRPDCDLAHPKWLIRRLARSWPDDWEAVARANNMQPPMWLRVNALRRNAVEYAEDISTRYGMTARAGFLAPEAVLLSEAVDVNALPGFSEGEVSVQDGAAQLAPRFVQSGPGMRILDACAAPGGKTCHLLETCPGLDELVAVDVDGDRIKRLNDNLSRLGLSATVIAADVTETGKWWDGRPFDRVVLDVPCSATGVIRRHPDIKLTRREEDMSKLIRRQSELIRAIWPLLAIGGRLVYISCSVLAEENAEVLDDFLSTTTDAGKAALPGPLAKAGVGRSSGPGLQLLPGEADMDGFYYACLSKKS